MTSRLWLGGIKWTISINFGFPPGEVDLCCGRPIVNGNNPPIFLKDVWGLFLGFRSFLRFKRTNKIRNCRCRFPESGIGLWFMKNNLRLRMGTWLLAPALFLATSSVALAEFKVGIVLDKGGKDDKSFNSAAVKGSDEAKKDLKVFTKYVEATDDNAFEPMLRAFAQKDFDLIVGIGFAQTEAIKKVAASFP